MCGNTRTVSWTDRKQPSTGAQFELATEETARFETNAFLQNQRVEYDGILPFEKTALQRKGATLQ